VSPGKEFALRALPKHEHDPAVKSPLREGVRHAHRFKCAPPRHPRDLLVIELARHHELRRGEPHPSPFRNFRHQERVEVADHVSEELGPREQIQLDPGHVGSLLAKQLVIQGTRGAQIARIARPRYRKFRAQRRACRGLLLGRGESCFVSGVELGRGRCFSREVGLREERGCFRYLIRWRGGGGCHRGTVHSIAVTPSRRRNFQRLLRCVNRGGEDDPLPPVDPGLPPLHVTQPCPGEGLHHHPMPRVPDHPLHPAVRKACCLPSRSLTPGLFWRAFPSRLKGPQGSVGVNARLHPNDPKSRSIPQSILLVPPTLPTRAIHGWLLPELPLLAGRSHRRGACSEEQPLPPESPKLGPDLPSRCLDQARVGEFREEAGLFRIEHHRGVVLLDLAYASMSSPH